METEKKVITVDFIRKMIYVVHPTPMDSGQFVEKVKLLPNSTKVEAFRIKYKIYSNAIDRFIKHNLIKGIPVIDVQHNTVIDDWHSYQEFLNAYYTDVQDYFYSLESAEVDLWFYRRLKLKEDPKDRILRPYLEDLVPYWLDNKLMDYLEKFFMSYGYKYDMSADSERFTDYTMIIRKDKRSSKSPIQDVKTKTGSAWKQSLLLLFQTYLEIRFLLDHDIQPQKSEQAAAYFATEEIALKAAEAMEQHGETIISVGYNPCGDNWEVVYEYIPEVTSFFNMDKDEDEE